jgi:3'-phosphoadenosine 5'-phosphosulfate sulfotransferase (PAPS reductase)/FAD synthetase
MIEDKDRICAASISYGKDSLAMLHVITDVLHWRLDRIITADVWATDNLSADYPPMAEFKIYADEEIKKRWGITVEHFCAMRDGKKVTYDSEFHRVRKKGHRIGEIYGLPCLRKPWCNSNLKMAALKLARKSSAGCIEYVGIAADEGKRTQRHIEKSKTSLERLPLVEADWTESMCYDWCKKNGLLSPSYETSARDGCWFCHNQSIGQLRTLRNNYPSLWQMFMQWNKESKFPLKPDGKKLQDYERRFIWEDEGYKPTESGFRWSDTVYAQMNIEQFLGDRNED